MQTRRHHLLHQRSPTDGAHPLSCFHGTHAMCVATCGATRVVIQLVMSLTAPRQAITVWSSMANCGKPWLTDDALLSLVGSVFPTARQTPQSMRQPQCPLTTFVCAHTHNHFADRSTPQGHHGCGGHFVRAVQHSVSHSCCRREADAADRFWCSRRRVSSGPCSLFLDANHHQLGHCPHSAGEANKPTTQRL